MKAFAIRLKELRIEKNLSVAALAELLGVSHKSILRWESGTGRQPKFDKLVEICLFFGGGSDYILGVK